MQEVAEVGIEHKARPFVHGGRGKGLRCHRASTDDMAE